MFKLFIVLIVIKLHVRVNIHFLIGFSFAGYYMATCLQIKDNI